MLIYTSAFWRRCQLALFFIVVATAMRAQPLPNTPIGAEKPPFSIEELQRRHFKFFWELAHKENYQVPDRWPTESFSSIAATGFGLSTYLVGAERGWITREEAARRVLNTLKVLLNLPQGPEAAGVAGYRGFFYHFLDTQKALRYQQVELSSIDTGLLMAGVLSCMTYFDADSPEEKEIRRIADTLYRRVEFDWFMNEQHRMSMGWFPEKGFLPAEWRGYNEAMVLVLMGMGSPTHPLPADAWEKWCQSYYRSTYKGQDMVNFGPLFGHQYSHIWVDFKGIQDPYMKKMGIDYFENSRRAALANRAYCIENPKRFKGYSADIWGLTACDGPGYAEKEHNGHRMVFDGYSARGAAFDYLVDDGTIAPTAAIASMPFAPEECLRTAEAMWKHYPVGEFGFFDAYNETFTWKKDWHNGHPEYDYWVDEDYLGIDQGPIVLMVENYRSQLIWKLMRKNPYIVRGLKRAGFQGGWLDSVPMPAYEQAASRQPNPEVPIDPRGFFSREMYSDAQGMKLPYHFMKPTVKNKTGKYPLVIFLHGSGERGTDNHAQMRNGVLAFAEKSTREKHPCYLLAPQCPPEQRWGGSSKDWQSLFSENPTEPGRMTLELIEKTLRENPNIDSDRIYITGLSMGGFGTFDLLMRRPELFAAGLPLCGGGDPKAAARIKNIPLWVFHGRMDDAVPFRLSENIVNALRTVGGKVKFTEYSTLNHNIWDVTYYNPAVLDWLFKQTKRR
ncbi:MAG: dienelactone hydrolase family protein [Chitinophagales bacterium]|nr:dienelactone hydrolase family protein [Chitinophagales bacterium]